MNHTFTAAEAAKKLKMPERTLRAKARQIGCFAEYARGKMIFDEQDLRTLLDECRSKLPDVKTRKTGTFGGPSKVSKLTKLRELTTNN